MLAAALGLCTTLLLLPEPNQRSLEEISNPYSDEGCDTCDTLCIDGNEDGQNDEHDGQQKHDEMKQPGS